MRLAAVALGVVAVAGCQTVEPNSAVPIPTGFAAARSGRTAPVPSTWVRGFGSAELDRLVATALGENNDIAAAIARITQAEAQAEIAAAALFPTVGLTSDASRAQQAGVSGGGALRRTTYSLGLTASYTLDIFGQNRLAARAALETARATRFDRDAVALSTVATVANTYFTVLASQDRLRIAEDNLRIAGQVLDALRGRVGVGTGTALDVAQQESVVATQRAAIPELRRDLGQNRNTLAILVGRTPESIAVRGGSLDRLRIPAVRPGLPSQLLLRRPDIAREEANLASAEADVGSARAAFFPTIQLTAGGGFQSAALAGLFGGSSSFYSLAAGLTQPVVDFGVRQGQLGVQGGRAAEYAATYRKAIIQSFVDVENALVGLRQSTEYEARLRDAVTASRRALDITQSRLREGTVDVVTLFQVQTTLFNNQDALARARLQRFGDAVSLFQALGGGWTGDRGVPVGTDEAGGAGFPATVSVPVAAGLAGVAP